jgi:hypothetical protein
MWLCWLNIACSEKLSVACFHEWNIWSHNIRGISYITKCIYIRSKEVISPVNLTSNQISLWLLSREILEYGDKENKIGIYPDGLNKTRNCGSYHFQYRPGTLSCEVTHVTRIRDTQNFIILGETIWNFCHVLISNSWRTLWSYILISRTVSLQQCFSVHACSANPKVSVDTFL